MNTLRLSSGGGRGRAILLAEKSTSFGFGRDSCLNVRNGAGLCTDTKRKP